MADCETRRHFGAVGGARARGAAGRRAGAGRRTSLTWNVAAALLEASESEKIFSQVLA